MSEEWECKKCGKCCHYYHMKVQPNEKWLSFLRQHYGNPNMNHLDLVIRHKCVHLTDEGLCDIHDSPDRHEFCDSWSCKDNNFFQKVAMVPGDRYMAMQVVPNES